jgi:DNA adenine methylase
MEEIKPVLKWAGGKQNLLSDLNKVFEMFDYKEHCFFDVFAGGGSVSFYLNNKSTVMNDINPELINVYNVIKQNPAELICELKEHKKNHSENYYYQIRNLDRNNEYKSMSNIKKAARTIYLNRTCFNGLTRYNKNGFFNVPIGRYKNPSIVMEDRITAINKFLNENDVVILNDDFETVCERCLKGDLIYFDPPYDYEKDGFTDYTKEGWSREDLKRLKELCDKLIYKECHVVISNNDTKYVNELFGDYKIKHIKAHRFINPKGCNRNNASEVIIYG